MSKHDDPTERALSSFWSNREQQAANLDDGGLAGGSARAGGHMNGIRDLVRDTFAEAGMPRSSIINEPVLPGYFRFGKKWDMAVTYRGVLVAALEFKSQVGSVAKNANNRFEEALGSATDLWLLKRKTNPSAAFRLGSDTYSC